MYLAANLSTLNAQQDRGSGGRQSVVHAGLPQPEAAVLLHELSATDDLTALHPVTRLAIIITLALASWGVVGSSILLIS
jgi:hypothetical protein